MLARLPSTRRKPPSVEFDPRWAELPAIFHITHHKAGSQWLLAILRRVARPIVIHPDDDLSHVRGVPLREGRVYPTVYLSRPDFEALDLPERWRRFIVIRDFRDAFVSAYWSLKLSHPRGLLAVDEPAEALAELNLHDGLMHLLPLWRSEAEIVSSWVGAEEGLIRYEDLLTDDVAILTELLYERLGLAKSPRQVEKVVESARFERMSKGRPRGVEDVTAHHRKGVPGDWRNYIVGPVAERFKELYGELLIETGYERDLDW